VEVMPLVALGVVAEVAAVVESVTLGCGSPVDVEDNEPLGEVVSGTLSLADVEYGNELVAVKGAEL